MVIDRRYCILMRDPDAIFRQGMGNGRDHGCPDHFSHRRDEAIAEPWECLDEMLLAGAFGQRLSQGRDVDIQIGFFNHSVRPQSFDQALPIHDLPWILHQQQEQIEFLSRQHDYLAMSVQAMLSGGKTIRAEFVALIVLLLQMSHKPYLAGLYTGLY